MKIIKRNGWDAAAIDLMFYQERSFNGVRQYWVAKPIALEFVKVEDGMPLPDEPTLRLSYEQWLQFVPSLRDLVKDSKIPTDENSAQSELKATKYHLEDMRAILFKKT